MVAQNNCTTNTSRRQDSVYPNSLIITSTFSVLGLPGNALIILLILRAKQRKSTTTCLLLSLAIADIVLLLGTQIVQVLVYLKKNECYEGPKFSFLLTVPKIVGNVTLATIALERYNALVRTMKRSLISITKKKILISVVITWFIALVLCVPLYYSDKPREAITSGNRKPPKEFFFYFSIFHIFIGYFIPLVMVVCCYSSILKGLHFDRTILAQTVTDEARLRENKRLVRVLVGITLVCLACNLPIIAIIMVMVYRERQKKHLLFNAIEILGCVSSSLNPYIYGLQSENYRNQVKQLFCSKKEDENARCSPANFDTKL